MSGPGRARERAALGARILAAPPPRRSYPEHPLRNLPRPLGTALLALVALALAWSAYAATAPPLAMSEGLSASGQSGDLELYGRIAQRVAGGADYYPAALAEQRAHHYPTRPFFTVRLPTLAIADAWLGRGPMGLVAVALLLANLLAWYRALAQRVVPIERAAAVLLVALGGIAAFEMRAGLMHELIAGLLLSLALAAYRPTFATPALLLLAAALAVRELALPFALLWVAFALHERRRDLVLTLAALLALFALGLLLHDLALEALRLPGDRASPGWAAMAGPRLFLAALARFTPLALLPGWLAQPLALLPLLGWTGLGGRLGLFAALWFVGMALVTALLARPANFYWVLMVLPAYAAGLAFVPRALADLTRAALRRGARGGA